MSHFIVLVVEEDYEEQLAPFHEYECTGTKDQYVVYIDAKEEYDDYYNSYKKEGQSYKDFLEDEGFVLHNGGDIPQQGYFTLDANGEVQSVFNYTNPNSKWDWYQLGGRWNGFFKLKSGTPENKGFIGESGVFGDSRENFTNRSDHTQKKYVDIDAMIKESEEHAAENFDRIIEVMGENPIPPIKTWGEFLKDDSMTMEEKREAYGNQEPLEKFRKARMFFNNYENFMCTKEEYINKNRYDTIVPFAIVKDQEWYEKGEMGWWASVSNEKYPKNWVKEFSEIWDSIPDDEWVSAVDCHI